MNKELIETVESLGGTALMGGILIQFSDTTFSDAVKKIYEAGAEAEREACAKVCEYKAERYAERAAKPEHERDINLDTARIAQQTCFHLADNIRARGQA